MVTNNCAQELIEVPASLFHQNKTEHGLVGERIRARFGQNVVVSGVDPSALDSVYMRDRTFGVPVGALERNSQTDDDPLVYASEGDLVIYDRNLLSPRPNWEYDVSDPEQAIIGTAKIIYKS